MIRFLNHDEVKSHRFYVAFLLALTTGMRQGEILGLQWKDIDFANKVLTVNRILTRIHGKFTFGDPKSESGNSRISSRSSTCRISGFTTCVTRMHLPLGTGRKNKGAVRAVGPLRLQHHDGYLHPCFKAPTG
ncbi:tyrosine-type recombinase/integrase [Alicyclobacillus contaminans]|uniref:tyrosine-type recombinase/integrase n=1 Tax=Alicyclobacillus contaminans TaxID=392016 RepID=UPI003CCC12DE